MGQQLVLDKVVEQLAADPHTNFERFVKLFAGQEIESHDQWVKCNKYFRGENGFAVYFNGDIEDTKQDIPRVVGSRKIPHHRYPVFTGSSLQQGDTILFRDAVYTIVMNQEIAIASIHGTYVKQTEEMMDITKGPNVEDRVPSPSLYQLLDQNCSPLFDIPSMSYPSWEELLTPQAQPPQKKEPDFKDSPSRDLFFCAIRSDRLTKYAQ